MVCLIAIAINVYSYRVSQSMGGIWWPEKCAYFLLRHRDGEVTFSDMVRTWVHVSGLPLHTWHPGFLGVMLTSSTRHPALTEGSQSDLPRTVMRMFICICWVLRASRVVLVVKKVLIAQSCPALCDRMDYRLPGSSVHEILQARILEWVAMPSSRWSSRPRDRTQVSCIADRLFTVRSTRETPEW